MEINNQVMKKYQIQAQEVVGFLKNKGITIKDKRILEIGFKNGLFLNECKKIGMLPYGIDNNKEYYEDVNSKFTGIEVTCSTAENMPFRENFFDLVVSFQVLEHVNNPKSVLKEAIRVLKPNGYIYFIFPNYRSFYEGHYNVIWLPFLNKRTGRIYLKILNKYTPYYESLNLIKPKMIRNMLEYEKNIEILSFGKEEFKNYFNKYYIDKINNTYLKGMIKLLNKSVLKDKIIQLVSYFEMYYPMKLIIIKSKEN